MNPGANSRSCSSSIGAGVSNTSGVSIGSSRMARDSSMSSLFDVLRLPVQNLRREEQHLLREHTIDTLGQLLVDQHIGQGLGNAHCVVAADGIHYRSQLADSPYQVKNAHPCAFRDPSVRASNSVSMASRCFHSSILPRESLLLLLGQQIYPADLHEVKAH